MDNRDAYFDNLKAILILLVVIGHFTFYSRGIPAIGGLNNDIYAFHMPLFVFVTGYFSKKVSQHRRSEIVQVLYPYLVFQILTLLFSKITGLGNGSMDLFLPTFQNWYLLGVLFWRLCVPYFNMFRTKKAMLLLLTVITIMIFATPFGPFLGLYRLIYFLPFFLVGYYCKDLKTILRPLQKFRFAFIAGFFAIAFGVWYLSFTNADWNKYLSFAFTPMDAYPRDAFRFLLRMFGLVASGMIGFCFLFLVPNGKSLLSFVGKNTLTIFLLHMFLVWPIIAMTDDTNPYYIVEIVVFSIAITLLLGLPFVHRLMQPFTDADFFGRMPKKSLHD